MKIKLYSLLLVLLPLLASAQDYSTSYSALKLPVSPRVAALGGQNITLIADEPSAGWANPALNANVSDLTFGLNFMTYTAGTSWMGAHFVKAFGERHTMAVGAQLMNYGEMDETDESGTVIGSFRAKDFVIGGGYSYLLSDRWTGGANLKLIYSGIADYSSLAFAIDLGVNYYNEETDLSLSATAQNIGATLKAYDDGMRIKMPFSLNLGLAKGLAHMPVRFHIAMVDLTRWKDSDYLQPIDEEKAPSFLTKTLNHFVLGVDIQPTEVFNLAVGYNFRRAYELKAAGSSKLAGLSAGLGFRIKQFQLGLSYAKYHQAGNSFMAGVGYTL